jgi:hypothetical protein
VVVGAVALGGSCARSSSVPAKGAPPPAVALEPIRATDGPTKTTEAVAPATSHLLGTIARKAIGPFAAGGKDGGVAAWIAAADAGGSADLMVVPLGPDGAPLRAPEVVAHVPREATSLVVQPTERARGGWLLAWSALLDRGESLTLLELAPDGSTRGDPIEAQRTSDHIAWADVVPTVTGALCLWAEETAAGDANLLALPIDANGKPHGVPVRVVRGVQRWAAARAHDGVAVALVTRDGRSAAGAASWLRLDAQGGAKGLPVAIGKEPNVSGDIDVVPSGDGWLLGWTDRTGEDAQVTLAAVDDSGRVEGPVHPMNAVGGSSLVALASGPAGAALAWDSPHGLKRPSHLLHLASISAAGTLTAQPVTSFAVVAGASTELVAIDDGFGLLATPVPSCPPENANRIACPVVPMFLRYDAHFAPTQAEPFFVGKTRAAATLGWALHCAGGQCVALAAAGDTTASVFAVDLARRPSEFGPPPPPIPSDAPRATGVVTLASGRPYIDVAATAAGAATVVAMLTNAVDVPTDPAHSGAATIVVRAFDDQGRPLERASTLTSRALPVGRVAIAGAGPAAGSRSAPDPRRGELPSVALAWVARDDGDAQVHVARLDSRGRRDKEAQLTTAKGEASDVAVAWAGDGWVVAWVDWRDGNGEVYAAKLDRNLNRAGSDQRITRAPGDAADVSLAWGGPAGGADVVWVAWTDPRESPREGLGDVYVSRLSARDAKRAGEEVRLLSTAAHSRSPQLAVLGGGVVVGWIEDPPSGVDAPGAAIFARVDRSGRMVGAPETLPLAAPGQPTAIALEASSGDGYTRAIVARSAHDSVTLDATRLAWTGAPPPTAPAADLEAAPPFDVALALVGGAVLYNDTGAAAADHRVRRMAISWDGR